MKKLVKFIAVAVPFAAFVLVGAPALAFHDGGVANCGGCHSIHSSPSSQFLLMQTDPSSTCLRCHERANDTGPSSYHISTPAAELTDLTLPPKQRTPGGDFGWLRMDYSALNTRGTNVTNFGYTRGHNIVAMDNGYTYVDGATAPGGSMPAGELACTSCHDPHSKARRLSDGSIITPSGATLTAPIFESGSYGFIPAAGEAAGVYRLLGGTGYQAYTGGPTYPGNPAAVVPSTYNRTEAVTQTRTAYGYSTSTNGYASWGKWCATCHPNMHTDTASNLVHEVDAALGGEATTYNSYIKSGDLTGTPPVGGSVANSFTSLVPFASNTNDVATLAAMAKNDDTNLAGPAATDRILCFSCHRAHASGWKFSLRWNNEAEFMTIADSGGAPIYPGKELAGTIGNQGQYNQGYTTAQMTAAYYGRPATVFAAHQRSYCNKCHAKD